MTDQGSNPADFKLFVYHQTSTGTLDTPVTVSYSSLSGEGTETTGWRRRTAIGSKDLNADGVPDLVVGVRGGFAVVYGQKQRNYVARRVSNVMGTSGDSFVFLDADRDGNMDIASQNQSSGDPRWGTTVFFGDQAGTFDRQIFIPTSDDGNIELRGGDLNSDGITDLAVAFGQGLAQRVEVRYGNGSGGFSDKVTVPAPADIIRGLTTIAVGDFSGSDGKDDLVAAGTDQNFTGGTFWIFKQLGNALSPSAVKLPSLAPKDTSHTPDTSLATDLNGDGKTDFLVQRSGGSLSYFEQKNGELSTEQNYAGPYATWGGLTPIAVGDLNRDGCRDVAMANYNAGLVVWLGRGC
ncbi:MAG: VCBS repeat-containing protein [Alphaproteobacteria bacterium]|nr:MAG: VCBS repeat-containing protein [Alphaproteobacteria bacterium]